MTLQIQRPSTLDVTVNNPNKILYVTGDETTDGSIRFLFTTGDRESHIERRAEGVWNDTGFRVSANSVFIGRDLVLSGAAGFIETRNPSANVGHIRGLIPHIEFDDDGTKLMHAPILDVEEVFNVYTTAVSEIIGTTIGVSLGVSPGRIIEESIHETGSVGATSPITVSIYDGVDNTGFLKNRRILPTALMATANAEFEINYDNDLGFEENEQNFMEFTSESTFSLKVDALNNPLTKHEAHELDEVGIITENAMYDNDLGHILDNSLNPVYQNQFN